MEQTAMQEMIEWAISLKDKEQQCIDWIAIKSKAEELLVLEKVQIITAMMYTFHQENTLPYGMEYLLKRDRMREDFENYYDETYNK